MSDQAVIVHYVLGEDFGADGRLDAIFDLEHRLIADIEARDAGEFDGNEIGGGEVVLYAYGPDADRLFAAMEDGVRSFSARLAYAILRYGAVDDPTAAERRIDL